VTPSGAGSGPLSEASMRGVRLCVVGNINRDVKAAPVEDGARLLQDGETSSGYARRSGEGPRTALLRRRPWGRM
jgi:hypothetical protein